MKRLTRRFFLLAIVFFLILFGYLMQRGSGQSVDRAESFSSEKGEVDVRGIVEGLVSQQDIPPIALRDLFASPYLPAKESENSSSQRNGDRKPDMSHPTQSVAMKVTTPAVLVGIVIRKQSRRAFFVDGDERLTLGKGDLLQGRYRVLGIRADRVHVKDTTSGLARTIYLKN